MQSLSGPTSSANLPRCVLCPLASPPPLSLPSLAAVESALLPVPPKTLVFPQTPAR